MLIFFQIMVSFSYKRLVVPEEDEVSEERPSINHVEACEKTPLIANGTSTNAINA